MTFNEGRRSVRFAQRIGGGGKVMSTFRVLIEREVTLTERLDEIEAKRLPKIIVLIHPGFDDEREVRLDREDALGLYHALGDAIMATAPQPTAPTSHDGASA